MRLHAFAEEFEHTTFEIGNGFEDAADDFNSRIEYVAVLGSFEAASDSTEQFDCPADCLYSCSKPE